MVDRTVPRSISGAVAMAKPQANSALRPLDRQGLGDIDEFSQPP